MSDKCGNCDCADKSQCVIYYVKIVKDCFRSVVLITKKGNNYGVDIVEPEKSYICTFVMDAPAVAEQGGKCMCSSSCICTSCTCSQ